MAEVKARTRDDLQRCCAHGVAPREVLGLAERMASDSGLNLTPQRREVLHLLATSPRPLGAYEILEQMKDAKGKRPAPVTVYRALDFLLAHGFAHRIESRNAFIACSHIHKPKDLVVFMICETCSCVTEAPASLLVPQIDAVAAQIGFAPGSRMLEIFGRCAHCQQD